ncbi:ankyrin repeat-containing protein [Anaeramoeba ignava]|uniref:Ankyrin repeat-containing protein n=1 Tax=Anaeramoeba ignava TaxID=1746090 RepID=A0A9Q0L9U6_ANAIG|nr:ankyrin repeat-containing protein [Anaeramoeba ignava]
MDFFRNRALSVNDVSVVLDRYADFRDDDNQLTLLHIVCKKKISSETFHGYLLELQNQKDLLESKSDPNSIDNSQHSPLHYACKIQSGTETINTLLSYKADPNIKDSESNQPLHFACKFSAGIGTIKLLVQNKAKINKANKKGETPLLLSCKHNASIKTIEYLLDQKADATVFDKQKNNSLHYACRYKEKNLHLIQLLYQNGTDLNARNEDLVTPFLYACSNGAKIEVLEFLLSNGANIHDLDKFGNSPLHYAALLNAEYSVFQFLLEKGVDVNLTNQKGESVLHLLSLQNSDPQIFELILQSGANVNLKDNDNMTPLFRLCFFGSRAFNSIILLISYGAVYFGKTPCNLSPNPTSSSMSIFSNEILRLYTKQLFCDLHISSSTNKLFGAHKLILSFRLTKNLDQIFPKFSTFSNEELEYFLRFIYSGVINNQEDFDLIAKLGDKLGISKEVIFSKMSRSGLISDFQKMFQDEDSKDFKILLGNEHIKVHKLVLVARSGLYRGMFLNVKDDSNQVNDYNSRSFQFLQHFIKFLYYDDIPNDLSPGFYKDFIKSIDFYQLNTDSYLKLRSNQILKNFKGKTNSNSKKKREEKKNRRNDEWEDFFK